jgi:hypothetical protein
VRAATAHAKETLTVRIVLVTDDGLQLAAFHLNQHSAERWMTIHGTHGSHNFTGSGHGHLQLRAAGRKILTEMAYDGTRTTETRVRVGPSGLVATIRTIVRTSLEMTVETADEPPFTLCAISAIILFHLLATPGISSLPCRDCGYLFGSKGGSRDEPSAHLRSPVRSLLRRY